jgi:hypothetical protein
MRLNFFLITWPVECRAQNIENRLSKRLHKKMTPVTLLILKEKAVLGDVHVWIIAASPARNINTKPWSISKPNGPLPYN